MPELHNLQTYLSLESRSPEAALSLYAQQLERIALWNPTLKDWLDEVRCTPADDGIVYARPAPALVARGLIIQPYVMGWTPRVIPPLRSDWLELGVWLRTEQISRDSPQDFRYRPEVTRTIYELATAFMPLLVDAPVFLTDEIQDGKPWEAWRGDGDEPWAFDLAIVANGVPWPHEPLPAGLAQIDIPGGRAFARPKMWCVIPWLA